MNRLIILCVLLALGLFSGPLLVDQKGYVLIAMGNLTIEMSVVSLVMGIVLFMLSVWVVKWLLIRGLNLSSTTRRWLANLGGNQEAKLALAYSALELQQADIASKQLKSLDHQDLYGNSLLALAKASQQQGKTAEALEYWQQAAAFVQTAAAANAHLADYYIQQQDYPAAQRALEQVPAKQTHWNSIIELKLLLLAKQNQWSALKQQLKQHKKHLASERYDHWLQMSAKGELALVASKQGALELKQSWQHLPRSERKQAAKQAAYVEQLIGQGMFQDAESALVEYQKKGPSPLLLPLFKQLQLPQAVAAKKLLESWLKQDENNAELLSTLGYLAAASKDWQLADKALSKAVKLEADKGDILLLAQAKEAQQQPEQAFALYKQAAAI